MTISSLKVHGNRRNTYSALSALAGHYNNFGPETNVPKKRLDRLTKVNRTYHLFNSLIHVMFKNEF